MSPSSYHVGTATIIESLLKRKWSVIILRHLANGISDPAEIRKREEALTPLAINERLRNMLRYGLITCYRRLTRPKSARYRPSPRGYQIIEVLDLIDRLDKQNSPAERSAQEEPGTPVPRIPMAHPPTKKPSKSS
ncbi:MAG: DNA-binding transcriptional regulator [Verrucomicrobia bacterium]|nr:MAG: DNA-binding transcriptional regulator [Verrucomicrobiota bacterium]